MTENSSLKSEFLEQQYETLTSLGQSEAKGVFLCKDKRNGNFVVKKYVSPDTYAVYEKLKPLSNPHIAHIYDTAFDERRGMIIEEFINGRTLREFIQTYGLPDEETLCRMVCDICDALSAAHSFHIIHRDINPDNIMISNDGILKIIDFGIARIQKEGAPQDTSFLGTTDYAPPEQFGFAQTDERSDIYSIGIVMGELLLGEPLPAESLRKQKDRLGPFEPIIQKCIEMDPKQRFQNVSELRSAVLAQPSLSISSAKINTRKKNQPDSSKGVVISGFPGFRSGVIWKNIVATLGYLFLILCTYIMITAENYTASAEIFLLELFALFLCFWASILTGFNVWNWDRKIYPFSKLPTYLAVIFRVLLAFILFYAGMLLENYVKYTLMGLIPKN